MEGRGRRYQISSHLYLVLFSPILILISEKKNAFFISILSSFGVAEAEDAKSGSDTEEEDEGEGGLLANADELNREIAPPSRSRQMNAGNLDAKIVKALKKQEEKREKRVTRKKEVCQYIF